MKKTAEVHRKDKKTIIDILSESFAKDPHINWMVGHGKHKMNRIRRLMSYAFEYALLNGTIQITEDRKAVALWKSSASNKMNLPLFLENIKFLMAFGLNRLGRITRMEKELMGRYPKNGNYKYLWFIGTKSECQGKGYASSLLVPELDKAVSANLPIYLETTTLGNVRYYQNRGFEIFDEVLLREGAEIKVYMMRFERNSVLLKVV